MKIGVLGGSFDPVHRGHLLLARKAQKKLALDRILFIPAYQNPLKSTLPADIRHRFVMLALALRKEDTFFLSDFELQHPGKSYTYDTLVHLHKIFPGGKFYLLAGTDNLSQFKRWHRFQELEKLCQIVLISRGKRSAEQYPVLPFSCPVSSTQIRKKLKNGEPVTRMVPAETLKYIKKNGLYI
ncbi:MAG: nicotinate (nicotinamide) nucleotide adenylyltransferase [Candidatus Wallbacteria bacterium]|nr:nicotinate (nicotinamide) nucleotide adenylyltransferase [Candidatus Wallbacteria bacterium]